MGNGIEGALVHLHASSKSPYSAASAFFYRPADGHITTIAVGVQRKGDKRIDWYKARWNGPALDDRAEMPRDSRADRKAYEEAREALLISAYQILGRREYRTTRHSMHADVGDIIAAHLHKNSDNCPASR
jgi:hypothetical protein